MVVKFQGNKEIGFLIVERKTPTKMKLMNHAVVTLDLEIIMIRENAEQQNEVPLVTDGGPEVNHVLTPWITLKLIIAI